MLRSRFRPARIRLVAAVAVGALAVAASCTPNVSSGGSPYPAIPTSGRYASQQFTDAQLTVLTARTYGSAVDVDGNSVALLLDLYLPPGRTAPTPTVVTVHGGGYIRGSRSEMASTARSYARRGFVVANIDYRLDPRATDSPERFLSAAQDAVDDGMEAVRWLKANATEHHVDTTRIALLGSSAGGGVALGVGAADDPTPGGPLAAHDPSIAAAVSTGATLSPGIDAGLVTIEASDAPALMFHHDQDSVTQFVADYARRTCDLLVLAGSRCRWLQQYGRGHTVPLGADGSNFASEIGPFFWAEMRLATAS